MSTATESPAFSSATSAANVNSDGTAERRIEIMGTRGHVVVRATPAVADHLADHAVVRLDELEQRWSRFLPNSEISRWNAGGSAPFRPSEPTRRLVAAARGAAKRTDGRFDPTLLAPLRSLGYDCSFSPDLRGGRVVEEPESTGPRGITMDPCTGTIRLPDGLAFDPGGIGKGLAADIISAELMARGAEHVIVNLGGDLRIRHIAQDRASSVRPVDIEIIEPALGPSAVTTVRLDHGAVATSTTLRRRWNGPDGSLHHILDPFTHRPTRSAAVLATVIAGDGWWAEAAATALIVDPSYVPDRCVALLVFADGERRTIGDFEHYCSSPEASS